MGMGMGTSTNEAAGLRKARGLYPSASVEGIQVVPNGQAYVPEDPEPALHGLVDSKPFQVAQHIPVVGYPTNALALASHLKRANYEAAAADALGLLTPVGMAQPTAKAGLRAARQTAVDLGVNPVAARNASNIAGWLAR